VLGYGRGEEVLPLEDLPELSMVIVTPAIGVSTPKAFADWDVMVENNADGTPAARAVGLTGAAASVRLNTFSHSVFAWLTSGYRFPASGVPASGGDRAEAPLLDLVRTGIENDFERVVFPQHPELRDIKRALYGREGNGARYASLSGSGSTMYGLFDSAEKAERIAGEVRNLGHTVLVTTTLTRQRYWGEMALKQ
jgi:4-diphosphocytidyl-2-C-methyl-D-erythritol kinase